MSIFARNGRLDGFVTARNGGFADFAKKSRQREAPSQSPLRAPLGHAAELGIVSRTRAVPRPLCLA